MIQGLRERLAGGAPDSPARRAKMAFDGTVLRLPGAAVGQATGHSARRLNKIAAGLPQCTSYLEVGVQRGYTLANVVVPFKWGVDPVPRFRRTGMPQGVRFSSQTSDDFFAQLPASVKFDLIFLDGLHEWRQTYRDLINALDHSHVGTVIVIDDIHPDDEFAALPDQAESYRLKEAAGITNRRWQGDVYKVLLMVADHHPELEFVVVGDGDPDENDQALLWRRLPLPEGGQAADPALLDHFQVLTYADVYPESAWQSALRPVPEELAVAAAIAGVTAAL